MRKTFILMFLSLVSIASFGQSLEGSWIIDKTVLDKTVDGVSSSVTYLKGDTTRTFRFRPESALITANEIALGYQGGAQKAISYALDGGKLIIQTLTAPLSYDYILNGNQIQLDYKVRYVINGEQQVEEVYHFYGHRE